MKRSSTHARNTYTMWRGHKAAEIPGHVKMENLTLCVFYHDKNNQKQEQRQQASGTEVVVGNSIKVALNSVSLKCHIYG